VNARRRILLVNPNISPVVTDILANAAQQIVGERAEIRAVTAAFGSPSLECRAELAVAAHAVLEAIASETSFDAVLIGAFGDPGLEAARDIVAAPVFGLGQSGMRAAGADRRRFAIVTLGERLRPEIERAVANLGLSDQLASIRFLRASVLEIAQDRAAFFDALAAAVHACVRSDGAQGVLLGGAPFAGISGALADRIGVPVFDGLTSAIEDAMGAAPIAQRAIAKSPRLGKAMIGVSPALAEQIQDHLQRGG
jgi:allantoin racemase